jgi:hypothetical protein
MCSGRCGSEVGFKFNVNNCYGYFAMVGWYGMGPDISVMKARWQAVSRTLHVGTWYCIVLFKSIFY